MRFTGSRSAMLAVSAITAVLVLAGCGSGGSSGGSSSSSGGAKPQCTEASLKTAVAPGEQIVKWGCAPIGGGEVAAVQVSTSNGYSPVFWFKSGATQWYPADGAAICTESLPTDLAAFCGSGPSPTASPTKTANPASICTDAQISSAVKGAAGANVKIDGFQCASAGTTEYAAVRVTDGGLLKTYFFENENNQWVLVNNSVCQDPAVTSDPAFQAYCKQ